MQRMKDRRVWAILLVLVLALVIGVVVLRVATARPQAAAVPGDVTAADKAAAARVDRALADVHASWLHPLGDEVVDGCYTEQPTVGDPPPVHCDRTVVRYFGFDGKVADLAAMLSRAGWSVDLSPARDHPAYTAGSRRGAQWLAVGWAPHAQSLPRLTTYGRPHMPHDPTAAYREVRLVDRGAMANRRVVEVGITDRYFGT